MNIHEKEENIVTQLQSQSPTYFIYNEWEHDNSTNHKAWTKVSMNVNEPLLTLNWSIIYHTNSTRYLYLDILQKILLDQIPANNYTNTLDTHTFKAMKEKSKTTLDMDQQTDTFKETDKKTWNDKL